MVTIVSSAPTAQGQQGETVNSCDTFVNNVCKLVRAGPDMDCGVHCMFVSDGIVRNDVMRISVQIMGIDRVEESRRLLKGMFHQV